jgi:hypothetical protein
MGLCKTGYHPNPVTGGVYVNIRGYFVKWQIPTVLFTQFCAMLPVQEMQNGPAFA